jgi:hypothetical protein
MERIDFSKQTFRCSSLGSLMTNQPGKKDTKSIEEISATAIKELVKIFVYQVYGREKEIKSKYIQKGLECEEDSITLLSRIYHVPFFKNDERKTNEFITGEADIVDPRLMDTKSCWDLHSFFEHKTKKLDKDYEYQILGYCDLYDKSYGTVCFCLIDTPLGLIEQEKRNLLYKMNSVSDQNPVYLQAAEALEKEMTFGDIPLKDRVYEVEVKRNPGEMERVYARVPLWREWLQMFAERHYEEKETVALVA